jgi:hypothetical protein
MSKLANHYPAFFQMDKPSEMAFFAEFGKKRVELSDSIANLLERLFGTELQD